MSKITCSDNWGHRTYKLREMEIPSQYGGTIILEGNKKVRYYSEEHTEDIHDHGHRHTIRTHKLYFKDKTSMGIEVEIDITSLRNVKDFKPDGRQRNAYLRRQEKRRPLTKRSSI